MNSGTISTEVNKRQRTGEAVYALPYIQTIPVRIPRNQSVMRLFVVYNNSQNKIRTLI
jgi:hypothetical protein